MGVEVKAGPIEVSAGSFMIEDLTLDDSGLNHNYKGSSEIGIDLRKSLTIEASIEKTVKASDNNYDMRGFLFNKKAENDWQLGGEFFGKNFGIKSPGKNNDIIWSIGGKAGIIFAGEAEVDINLTAIYNTGKYIITSKK